MPKDVVFNLKPLTPSDLPQPGTAEFTAFLDAHFAAGQKLAASIEQWTPNSTKPGGVRILTLNDKTMRKSLGINEFWCARISSHTPSSVEAEVDKQREAKEHSAGNGFTPSAIVRTVSKRLSLHVLRGGDKDKEPEPRKDRRATFELNDVERQEHIMSSQPRGLYESFRRGLLEYHSENEREYIESCRETSCLQVLEPHVAEVWRLTYVTPAPTSPRTFIVLLMSRELTSTPHGQRSFMNISIPFTHPSCPEKVGEEKSRVRGKYVSVELVKENDNGASVEWRMATSSDAGGNIPRFVTNSALPKSVAEDVPSFLGWLWRRFPVQNPLQLAAIGAALPAPEESPA